MNSNLQQDKELTRLERFWFAIGIFLFGIKGIPLADRTLPETSRASLKTERRVDIHEDQEARLLIRQQQAKS